MSQNLFEHLIRTIPDFPKPGIQFKDITPVLANPEARIWVLEALVAQLSGKSIDAVAGIESRGFLFGMLVAQRLGVPFVPIRKKGKLPHITFTEHYDLEYGTAEIEMHTDAVPSGARVLVHDDLLATGGTAAAAARLLLQAGAEVAAFQFLIELHNLKGRNLLEPFGAPVDALMLF
jgi:adenine phosphoribosyltransferase